MQVSRQRPCVPAFAWTNGKRIKPSYDHPPPQPLAALDYVEVADPETLEPLVRCDARARLFGAARFGRARLIDNVAVAEGSVGSGGS